MGSCGKKKKHVDTSTYSSISFMREQEAEFIVTNDVNTLCSKLQSNEI